MISLNCTVYWNRVVFISVLSMCENEMFVGINDSSILIFILNLLATQCKKCYKSHAFSNIWTVQNLTKSPVKSVAISTAHTPCLTLISPAT